MSRDKGSLRSTKGMPATPLRHRRSLTASGERATVAPRGWLHVTPLTSNVRTETEEFNINSFPAEVCEME
jgi:hypothetical protein